MMGHNSGAWIMPGALEEYIEHFQAADSAMRKLAAAIGQAEGLLNQARQNPLALAQPNFPVWPSRDQLQQLAQDAVSKINPLQAEYGRLAQEFRQYAPRPDTIGRNR